MKKSIKTVISFMVITLLVLSFSSCSIFEAMRENALNASQTTIYATPEEEKIIAEFNELLASSVNEASAITESISYSAGTPDVFKDGEEAGTLDAAAKQLKNFIMSAKPGSTSEVLEKGAESLLNQLDEAAVLEFNFTRNIASENVTDEKGNEVADEEGNVVTETYISDNILHLTFNYFANETVLGENVEASTDENGEAVEETTIIYAEDATIESVFGTPKDKEAVLKNFEVVKDYIAVSDYEIEYLNCLITSDADLEENRISFVNFQKNMKVTAKAQGVGALESYGEIEIVFNLTLNTNYSFEYETEEDDNDTVEETTEELTAEETASDEATSTEEASAAEQTSATEETIAEDTTAEEETTTAE